MNLNIIERNGQKIAEVRSDRIEISSVHDSLDLMGDADHLGARCAVIYERNINPDFFDLRTKIAGEILQKFMNYGFKLAIMGEFEKYRSSSLNAFIRECNRGSHIFFVRNLETALKKMM